MEPVGEKDVPAVVSSFANRVRHHPEHMTAPKHPFAQFYTPSFPQGSLLRLDKIYTFGLGDSGYKLDWMCMWYPSNLAEPCWGLSAYHEDWQAHLAKVEVLSLAECADWGDTVSSFLPENGSFVGGTATAQPTSDELPQVDMDSHQQPRDGILILLKKIEELSKLLFQAGSPTSNAELRNYPAIVPEVPDLIDFS